jgi:hypothetical protein
VRAPAPAAARLRRIARRASAGSLALDEGRALVRAALVEAGRPDILATVGPLLRRGFVWAAARDAITILESRPADAPALVA